MKVSVLLCMLVITVFSIFFSQCAEEPSPSLYDPNYKPEKADPVITSVEPADGTYAGIGEVTIKGQNFSSNSDMVHVYFDGVKADLLSASDTEVKVTAPVVAGDSVTIKMRIDGALLYAEFSPYKLEVAVREYGGINYVSDAYGVACDMNENLYVSLGEGKIIQITPDEEQHDYIAQAGGFYEAMKIGPSGKLYGVRQRFLYVASADLSTMERATARLLARPLDFDFDQNKNIYYVSTGGIFLIRQDFTDTLAADYTDITLSSVRVFNDFVYVTGTYAGSGSVDTRVGIWRNQILAADGQLSENETVFDLEDYYNTTVGIPDIRTITFAEDGDMYIGVDSTDISEAITVAHPAGNSYPVSNAEALYKVLLIPPASKFCWGNDQYLYVNRRSTSNADKVLLRLTMGKYSAPYYGRQ